jgi:NAD(P)H-dependent FMN reductase
MKTLILSSSLSKNSRSFILCNEVSKSLSKKGVDCTIVDARNIPMRPKHYELTSEMEAFADQIKETDNIIIGMGVHCYSVNDSLKILLDTCFSNATAKFYGILCAAGGERSYLSTMHLTQICMNEWRMIQLPRIVYATGKDFEGDSILSTELLERIDLFSEEFHSIGNKLLS